MAKRLLVVDDAMIIREIIKEAATKVGWEIVGEASNGADAVRLYQERTPDAVTLDLVMPQYDGLHALKGIRAHDPAAKVLIVSALDQKDVLKDTFRLGAADFLVKPFDRAVLTDTLEQLAAAAC